MLATRRNMLDNPGCTVYSPETGEEYSGDAADYFWLAMHEPLTDELGTAMILARKRTYWEEV